MAVIAEGADTRMQAVALGKARSAAIQDRFFFYLTLASAAFVVILLLGVMVSLLIGAWPALVTFGPAFIVTERWSPVKEIFGALAPIYGTIITSLIAMIIIVLSLVPGIVTMVRHKLEKRAAARKAAD